MPSKINKLLRSFQGSTEPIEVTVSTSAEILLDTQVCLNVEFEESEESETKKEFISFSIYLTTQVKDKLKSDKISHLDSGTKLILYKYTVSNLITKNLRNGKLFLIVTSLLVQN